MAMFEALLQEFEQEAVTTRKFLERLPEDKLEWRPHPKSMTAGQLAYHIAESPAQVLQMGLPDTFAMPKRDGNPQPASVAEVLSTFEKSLSTVRDLLPLYTDEKLGQLWRLTVDGKEILAMPRSAVVRSILLNHWYHHRGQFGVYLRLVGAKVPSSYGPSGDEPPAFMQK